MKKKLLFVCLGNICRSPSAEAVMNGYLKLNMLDDDYTCDSAGTGGWHAGERADSRMRTHAAKRDYDLTSIARQFNPKTDFDEFDLIIGMDPQNVADLEGMARNQEDLNKISSMTDYCIRYTHYNSVPDPYYGGSDGFELVLDILEDACEGLLKQIDR
ncbi:low molecular weight protein-tyrosine-phosphatase [Marinifilum caeruleilacunae]|jgi:protein-tyrosine phosphatase|uniref:Low molecular weight phosphotyrosine protein phosphatase n=1 Tax=Marinifilum caeruleilacunae TaxID=2499076 RepID=A0ABX1WQ55_9BACT|nr:low molecular weight protein-tyrosine-phosphatase [Marinifilum caeruleilacunae]NOU58211.1 low molecular weight phosphotyrosine protein phosphatase [Marinifilum caeruleilacunae]